MIYDDEVSFISEDFFLCLERGSGFDFAGLYAKIWVWLWRFGLVERGLKDTGPGRNEATRRRSEGGNEAYAGFVMSVHEYLILSCCTLATSKSRPLPAFST